MCPRQVALLPFHQAPQNLYHISSVKFLFASTTPSRIISLFPESSLVKMICDICQAVLTKAVCDSPVSDTGWSPYHQTAHGFKSSVGLGCYICNAVWSALNPVDQVLVSRAADSRPRPTSNGSRECLDELPEGSVEEFESTTWLDDGSAFGLPRCYLLQLAVHARTVATAGMTGDRLSANTSFVLQPRNGMFIA